MYYVLEHTERESEVKLCGLRSGGSGAQPPTSLEPEHSRPSAKRQVHSLFLYCLIIISILYYQSNEIKTEFTYSTLCNNTVLSVLK